MDHGGCVTDFVTLYEVEKFGPSSSHLYQSKASHKETTLAE